MQRWTGSENEHLCLYFRRKPHVLFFQPGKLTEAFKYFLQGMGYSEYISPLGSVLHLWLSPVKTNASASVAESFCAEGCEL